MWRTPATESRYSFYRIGWVNLESERTTEIKFPLGGIRTHNLLIDSPACYRWAITALCCLEWHTPGTKITLLRTYFWMLVRFTSAAIWTAFGKEIVFNGSSPIWDILLPSSAINSDDSGFQGPPVSMEIGTKWSVVASVLYFEILFAAALFAAAAVLSAVSARWHAAYVLGTVTSHARGFPRDYNSSIRSSSVDSRETDWGFEPLDRSPN